MKTKFLFYSLAVAAAMASCTQEVIDAPVNEAQDLSIRPTLGEVVLAEGEGLASRLAVGTGARPEFATGDKMGAAIMDAPKYPSTPYNESNPAANYDIVEYYSSNAGFLKDGDAWYMNSDQPLVEGNYLFYAPYNENLVLRTPFEVRVPQRQDISAEKSALNAYYADKNNVVVIGHKFLASENGKAQRPSVEYYDVMSYPKFTITNNFDGYLSQFIYDEEGNKTGTDSLVAYTGAVKLDSIQIAYADGQDATNTTPKSLIGGLLKNSNVVSALNPKNAEGWKNPLNNHLIDLLNENATIGTDSIITTFVAGGKEIAKGDTVSFFAVMPAVKYAKGTLQANIYVTVGEKPYLFTVANVALATKTVDEEEVKYADVTTGVTKAGYKFAKNSATLLQGQAYPQEELNWDGKNLTTKKVKGSILTMELVGGKLDGEEDPSTLQVAQEVSVDVEDEEEETTTDKIDNNEEFIQFFIDTYSNAEMKEAAKVDETKGEFAFSTNTTATINSELINALDKHQFDGTIKIDKALVIANDVQVISIDPTNKKVTFVSNTGKSYKIELGAGYTVDANYVKSGNLSLHVYRTYNVNDDMTFGNIRNGGTMDVAAKLTANSFVNKSVLNANAGANIVKPFTNDEIVNVNGENAIMTINNNKLVQTTNATAALSNVKVTGGEGKYNYSPDSNVDVYTAVKNAEKIAWVNSFSYAGTVDFVTAYTDGSASKTILEAVKDINKMYINDVFFATNDTIDMKNIHLVLSSIENNEIDGLDVAQTVVNNLKITLPGGKQIKLNNIAANGTLVSGDLYADGYNATWNGGAYGVIALDRTDASNWVVNTEAGLIELATLVNNGTSTAGITVKLAKDMDLANRDFTPIGESKIETSSDYAFAGIFDGNGKTIKNLTVKDKKANGNTCYAGLFGILANGAEVKDLTVEGAYIEGYHCVGVIVGQMYSKSHVKNCVVNNATVVCTNANNGADDGDKAGVIAGILNTAAGELSTIEGCKVSNSTVSAGRDAGQIAGFGIESNVKNCTVENVKVSANGTGTGENINDEPVGRKI